MRPQPSEAAGAWGGQENDGNSVLEHVLELEAIRTGATGSLG